MSLYEVGEKELIPVPQLKATGVEGRRIYEDDIEELIWENLDTFFGVPLFPVARSPQVAGGKPDIVALDTGGAVHVIEIKRDVERSQLAQCLEYAGWANETNLDELAGIYHKGKEDEGGHTGVGVESPFFEDWREFTDTASIQVIRRPSQVVLVARDYHSKTRAALDYLAENGLPITVLRIAIYGDIADERNGRRFIDVDSDHEFDAEAQVAQAGDRQTRTEFKIGGRRFQVRDLVDEKMLNPGDKLVWKRRNKGDKYSVEVTFDGKLCVQEGEQYDSPSKAATVLSGAQVAGWNMWRTEDGTTLAELRNIFYERRLHEAEDEVQATEGGGGAG